MGFTHEQVQQQVERLRAFGCAAPADVASDTESADSVNSQSDGEGSEADEAAACPHSRQFFVSLRCRTLHKGGECHRVPGVHSQRFACHGDVHLDGKHYQRLCKDCFPHGDGTLPPVNESSSDDGSDSSPSESQKPGDA